MNRKVVAGALAVLCAVCLVAGGCSVKASQEELDRLQGGVTIENPQHEDSYLAQFAQDDDMTLDGALDEEVWKDNPTAYTFAHSMSTADNPITMTTMNYLGENGLYVAFDVKDTAIYYSADRRASGNTSVELYVAAYAAQEWDGNSFRISVVPTEDGCVTEMYTYRSKTGVYQGTESLEREWAYWYKAHMAACRIDGAGVNTGMNEGYSVELFVPWASFGLAGAPEAVKYMTAFYHVESAASDADNVWSSCYPSASTNTFNTWLVATNDAVGSNDVMSEILRPAVPDDYMTMDGVFDEDVWHTENAIVYQIDSAQYGVDATVGTTAHLSDKGVYLAVEVRDSKVYATNERAVNLNTGIEVWVQSAAATHLTTDTVQLRIDALGNVTRYRGKASGDNFDLSYFPSVAKTKLLGCEAVNGVVASDTAEGFNVEIFIPWEQLGLSGKQEEIAVFPQYVHTADLENTDKSSNSVAWSFWCLSGQTPAKNDSQNAYLRLRDGGFEGALRADGLLFSAADLEADGSYTTEAALVMEYAGNLVNNKLPLLPVPVTEAVSLTDGVTLTAGGGGYALTCTKQFVEQCRNGAQISIRIGTETYTLDALFLPVVYDGAVTEEDGYYGTPSSFYAANGVCEMEATVYVAPGETGVAVALVLNSDYIDYKEGTSGNIGGGFELRMANSPDASTGISWRVFANGAVREAEGLTDAMGQAHARKPSDALAFAVGTVAADSGKGYRQMTVEFYLPYSAVGATSAEDFYLAVGVNGTNTSGGLPNTMMVRWMNNSATIAADCWLSAQALNAAQLESATVSAPDGEATFRVGAAFSEYVYFKGVTFGDADVTEGEQGYYSYTMSAAEEEQITATLGEQTATITVQFEVVAIVYDGAVTEKDEYYGTPYSFLTVNSDGYEVEATVYIYLQENGVGLAVVTEADYINYGTNPTGNNGGGFEIRMANSSAATTGLWWRVFADGTARTTTNLQGGVSQDRTAEPVGALNFAVGLVSNAAGDASKGYKQMTAEFFVPYSAVGATGADDFWFAIGLIATNKDNNGTMGTYFMDNTSPGNLIPPAAGWLKAADVGAAAMQDAQIATLDREVTFRIGSAMSPYVYFKGVDFGEADVTEGEHGYYSCTVTESRRLTATLGTCTAQIGIDYTDTGVVYDGAVTEEDGYYGTPFSFYTKRDAREMETTVYVAPGKTGVAVALVLNSDYINCKSGTGGDIGGGFELRIANSVQAVNCISWRIYVNGAAREAEGLTDSLVYDHTRKPSDALAFAVGNVPAADGNGYTQMTVEFYLPYSAVGAASAEELYLAVGTNGTSDANSKMKTVFMDGTDADTPFNGEATQARWFTVAQAAEAQLESTTVSAPGGKATFRVGAAFSEYVYFKGVTFGDADVTEGEQGYYSYTMSAAEEEQITATLGERTATITVQFAAESAG